MIDSFPEEIERLIKSGKTRDDKIWYWFLSASERGLSVFSKDIVKTLKSIPNPGYASLWHRLVMDREIFRKSNKLLGQVSETSSIFESQGGLFNVSSGALRNNITEEEYANSLSDFFEEDYELDKSLYQPIPEEEEIDG